MIRGAMAHVAMTRAAMTQAHLHEVRTDTDSAALLMAALSATSWGLVYAAVRLVL
jgi:hypothetical protein